MLAYEPPSLMELRWGDEVCASRWSRGAGTVLRSRPPSFDELGKVARDGAGWHACLDLLAREIAGSPRRGLRPIAGGTCTRVRRPLRARGFDDRAAREWELQVQLGRPRLDGLARSIGSELLDLQEREGVDDGSEHLPGDPGVEPALDAESPIRTSISSSLPAVDHAHAPCALVFDHLSDELPPLGRSPTSRVSTSSSRVMSDRASSRPSHVPNLPWVPCL